MFRVLFRLFAVIGFLTVLLGVGGGYLAYTLMFERTALPDATVIHLELQNSLAERAANDPLTGVLFGGEPSLRDVVEALERGRRDPRVKGLVVRFGGETMGLAQAQELRAAVARFRASGRFALAFSETFGEFGPANNAYYLASAFDEIWLQPVGMVGLTGYLAEVPFARKLLDRFGVKPEIQHRQEFKTAFDSLTETEFTEPHRQMMDSLIKDRTDQLLEGITAGRRVDPATLRALIDQGPLLDREALAAGLIDKLGYQDDVLAAAMGRAGAGADAVDLSDYLAATGPVYGSGPTVALIYALGAIQRGNGGTDPMLDENLVGADTVVEAVEQAVDDDDVRAILLRIDSPGGSAVASETIRRAIVQARAAGKPVIVSMGDTAASGGYWIAMDADRIIAHDGTLTGSIGVIAGKVVTADLWRELGIQWGRVEGGRNAAIWSSLEPYGERGQERLTAMLDDIYRGFTGRVAAARKLPEERVQEIAKGRVWTGRQALGLGLVDELGDLDLALVRAREAAGLKGDAAVRVQVFPRPRSTLERALELLASESEPLASPVRTALRTALGPLWPQMTAAVQAARGEGVARMPLVDLGR